MSDYDRYAPPRSGAGYARSGAAVDQGLRAYMLGVYNYMTLGLGVTGLVAWGAFQLGTQQLGDGRLGLTEFGHAIYVSPLRWLIVLSPLAIVFWISARIQSMSVASARNAFIAFAALTHRPVKAAGRARRALALSLPIVKRTALAGAPRPAI